MFLKPRWHVPDQNLVKCTPWDHKPCIGIRGNVIKMSDAVKLLGVTIDLKLNFNGHIKCARRPKIRLKLFQGLQETLTIKRLSSYTAHLCWKILTISHSSGCYVERQSMKKSMGFISVP